MALRKLGKRGKPYQPDFRKAFHLFSFHAGCPPPLPPSPICSRNLSWKSKRVYEYIWWMYSASALPSPSTPQCTFNANAFLAVEL